MTIKSKILSSYREFPFGSSVNNFFEHYDLEEDVECYYLYHSPFNEAGTTTIENLSQISYQSRVIFWIMMDSMVDRDNYQFYVQNKLKTLEQLENICNLNKDKIFILLLPQHNLQNQVSSKNLFISDFLNLQFSKKYEKCTKKSFVNRWVTFNRNPQPHRVALVSYLASKNIDKFGSINFDGEYFLTEKYDFSSYFKFETKHQQQLKNGFYRLYLGNIKKDKIASCHNQNFIENYNTNLLPIYERSFLEVITGSLFFEPTPFFSEKEIQSVYGKVFPIFINTYKAVSTWKEKFRMDVFDDIVNHSYDDLEDPTERLLSAIDLNIHLLDGTTDLVSLWLKNKDRFEENCSKMDRILYDIKFQQKMDENQIKKALDYFQIQYTLKCDT